MTELERQHKWPLEPNLLRLKVSGYTACRRVLVWKVSLTAQLFILDILRGQLAIFDSSAIAS